MSLTVEKTTEYSAPQEKLYQAAKDAILGLEGKIETEDAAQGIIEARFHKTIHGKVLGDRTWMKVEVSDGSGDHSALQLTAYPLNAVGQKLQFGARKGVLKTVITWFYAHLDHHLKK